MPETQTWAVVVHGGCKPIRPSEAAANRAGVERALAAAVSRLAGGGSALDAVEAAVRVLEDDPTFNAGRGSVANAEGDVEMDAAIMDGETLALGGVCAARDMLHPTSVARAMLPETPTLLAADGARRFAEQKGLLQPGASDRQAGRGEGVKTVGCVALDAHGRLAAATSTGGLKDAAPGRVGDSALPGCGVYADSASGAVSATGDGESISRCLLGARVIFALEAGQEPEAAVEAALRHLRRVGGDAGLIAVDRTGRIGWSHTGDQFAVGWASSANPMLKVELANMQAAAENDG